MEQTYTQQKIQKKSYLSPNSSITFAEKLLQRQHSPTTAANIYLTKVKDKPLALQRPPQLDPRAERRHLRSLKAHSLRTTKRKARVPENDGRPLPLSAKDKREMGLFHIPKGEQKWELYSSLRTLWLGYIREVLGLGGDITRGLNKDDAGAKIAAADWHGMVLTVVQSKCVSQVGLCGMVLREGRESVVIVTKADGVKKGGAKVLGKKECVFRVEIPLLDEEKRDEAEVKRIAGREVLEKVVVEIHGDMMVARPAERANKKFKWRGMRAL